MTQIKKLRKAREILLMGENESRKWKKKKVLGEENERMRGKSTQSELWHKENYNIKSFDIRRLLVRAFCRSPFSLFLFFTLLDRHCVSSSLTAFVLVEKKIFFFHEKIEQIFTRNAHVAFTMQAPKIFFSVPFLFFHRHHYHTTATFSVCIFPSVFVKMLIWNFSHSH